MNINNKNPLLEVKDLKTYFFTEDGIVKAVDGVGFKVNQGETLGLVGESGCGKSVTAFSIIRLLDYPGKTVGGEVIFKGENLLKKNDNEMRKIRGKDIAMIFQEPMTALNPVLSIGFQISEALMMHFEISKKEAMKKSVELLKKVGIPMPEERINEYPHQLSTTALDVTIQAQILDLMRTLLREFNGSLIMITHDLGVIAKVADKIAVMYASKIVEYADKKTIFHNPLHPYTFGLLTSIPRLDVEMKRLNPIPGIVPNPLNFPSGCKFNPRCRFATEKCKKEEPPLIEIEEGHLVRCWNIERVANY